MKRIEGQPILTAAGMRAAEDAAIVSGTTVGALTTRAGRAVAGAVRRLAGDSDVLVLCGPGNNGGDGYVAAQALVEAGLRVRVAAPTEPRTPAAMAARAGWTGAIEPIDGAAPAAIVVDALFGTGLTRPLEPTLVAALVRLRLDAALMIAVDVPSGVATDNGALLSDIPRLDLTLALGAVKPAHVLQPSAARCGDVRVLDIGVIATSDAGVLARPTLAAPGAQAHKYSRGMVAIVAGRMAGAAALSATAAASSGAGYVLLLGSATDRVPHAIVRRSYAAALLDDRRIGALLVGPGLGRDDAATAKLEDALASDRALVIDGDALHLLDAARLDWLVRRGASAILTPHSGEFDAVFGADAGSKIDRTRKAARTCGQTVVFKGADTVIAAPDGRVRVATGASPWLSTAGTGDVLAGVVAARLAATGDPFEVAAEGVWLHAEAACRAGPAFVADALAAHLSGALAACP